MTAFVNLWLSKIYNLPLYNKFIPVLDIASEFLFKTLWLLEEALHKCSYKKVFWKYTANLHANAHAKARFQ